jgi:M6 family metalloprotease-like protein
MSALLGTLKSSGPSRRIGLLALGAAALVLLGIGAATAVQRDSAPAAPVRTIDLSPAARPGPFVDFVLPADTTIGLRQPNGATVAGRLTPVEIGAEMEVDGYTVGKGADGWWRYATGRQKASARDLVLSDARAGVDAVPAGISPGVGRIRNLFDDGQGGDIREQVFALFREASRQAQLEAAAAGEPRVFRFPVLMLATWWDPEEGQTRPTFQPGNDAEHFSRILDGFGGNPTGSLTEFYFESSFGQFLVEVDVFGPFTSLRSIEDRCYYGDINPSPVLDGDLDPLDNVFGIGGLGAAGMAVEAVPQADLQVDFRPYDNDDNGFVDFVGIIHSGADMATTGDQCHTWSHAIQISDIVGIAFSLAGLPAPITLGLPTTDGVQVDRVFTMPEFNEKGSQLNIGVAVHEMGHAIGEIDYYSVPGTSEGSGEWDVMAASGYLGRPIQSNPTMFNPASRIFQGWVTPTVVHGDVRDIVLRPRNISPKEGYRVGEPDPNLILVPTKWIKVGQTDEMGHEWTENDVYGLHEDGDLGYVIEGYFLEYVSRTARAPALTPEMHRSAYFERAALGSGLLTWHFDYFKRANILFGQNNGQDDANRLQMDVEEWDFNDNTQEIQLNFHRGEPSDVARDAAAGIGSGTGAPSPYFMPVSGAPQEGLTFSGAVTPGGTDTFEFEVEDNPANFTMTVRAGSSGDCTLTVYKKGTPPPDSVDSGGNGADEEFSVTQPEPGTWVAEVGDFLLCLNYDGSISFAAPAYDSKGGADTYSNWTRQPTGWAFTNIRSGEAENLSFGTDSVDDQTITLDVVHLDGTEIDVAPGFALPIENAVGGRDPVNVGRDNAMTVPIFNNGGAAAGDVAVVVREGSATGRVVAQGAVPLAAYQRGAFNFPYRPAAEGPYALFVTVDPSGALTEVVEGNNTQKVTGWAGPANPAVLVVDDDGAFDSQDAYTGSLAVLGVPYAIAERHVPAATMAQYEAVIWQAGVDREQGQLDEVDRREIATYLDGGGKLWLSSNRAVDAASVVAEDAFIAKYFGATLQEVETYDIPVAVKGTGSILGTVGFGLQPFAGRAFIDLIQVASEGVAGTAEPIIALDGAVKPGDAGKFMGTHVGGGAFKTVLNTFNLAQASSPDGAIAMVRAVMAHFGVAGGRYVAGGAQPLIFHTLVRLEQSGTEFPVRAIVAGGEAGQSVALHYRRHGLGGYYRVEMLPGAEPGSYVGIVPGNAVTPDGIDYFLDVAGTTFDPAIAATRAGAHTIGVAEPEVAGAAAILPADEGGPPAAGPLPATGTADGTAFLAVALLALGFALRRRRLMSS